MATTAAPDGQLTGHPHERGEVEAVVGHAQRRRPDERQGQRRPVGQDGHQHPAEDGDTAQVGHGPGLRLQLAGAVRGPGAIGHEYGQRGEHHGHHERQDSQSDEAHARSAIHCITSERVPACSSNSLSATKPDRP